MAKRKPKPRSIHHLKRRAAVREPYPKVLIVTEGQTEANYFKDFRHQYALSSMNISVVVSKGSAPVSLLEHAEELYKQEKDLGDGYDEVYCVIDRDEHTNVDNVISSINYKKDEDCKWSVIVSDPCFEFWLLLHFEETRASFARTERSTAAKNCEKALRKYLPDYKKGRSNLFDKLSDNLELAKKRSKRVKAAAIKTGESNPSTDMHQLIDCLQKILTIQAWR